MQWSLDQELVRGSRVKSLNRRKSSAWMVPFAAPTFELAIERVKRAFLLTDRAEKRMREGVDRLRGGKGRMFRIELRTKRGVKRRAIIAVDRRDKCRIMVFFLPSRETALPTVSARLCDSGVLVFSRTNVLYANRALSRMLDVRPERLAGMPIGEVKFFRGLEAFSRLYREVGVKGAVARMVSVDGPCGVRLTARAKLQPCAFQGRRAVLLELMPLDDELLEYASAWRSRGELFSNITHEMRVQLNVISGAARLIGMPSSDPGKYSAILDENVSTMLRLCNNVIDLDRVNNLSLKLNKQSVNLCAVLSEIARNASAFADARGLTFQLELPGHAVAALCDPPYFERAVYNLISNAVKFTPPGGRVGLSLRTVRGEARVIVSDTGPGIPKKHLRTIFDRCFVCGRSAASGSGIGLALVRRLMELHGGSVSVSSRLGEGSRFALHLPMADESVLANTGAAVCLSGVSAGVELAGL